MIAVKLIVDTYNREHGRRRAERVTEFQAVPAAGDVIDVGGLVVLKVQAVRWSVRDADILVFLTRSEGTFESIVDLDGELEMPETYVKDLEDAGWELTGRELVRIVERERGGEATRRALDRRRAPTPRRARARQHRCALFSRP